MVGKFGLADIKWTEESVDITWTDGHDSTYNFKYLRVNCGCAECVEEWTNRRLLDPATVSYDINVEDYITVGKYAIQFLWSDTHYTGIYPFDLMRKLCQCSECLTPSK